MRTKRKSAYKVELLAAVIAVHTMCGAAEEGPINEQGTAHWAFQKVTRPQVPQIKKTGWTRNPIDAFIAAELESKRIAPGKPADKATLLRRANLDLIGLPPTSQEIDDFLADKSPEAFGKAVDRLLASPHYGERWARHWLDLARYAESEGFKADETRPNAWRYRDYVINSLNTDKPYDRFLKEQIAGDELWPGDSDAQIATAFNRHYPDESNARNIMQRRQEILNDVTDTVGGVFLGLTYACARCHDHKFDPILQTDYYRLQAFFANTAAKDDVVLASPAEVRRHQERLAMWEEKTKEICAEMATIEEPHRRAIVKDYFDKYPSEIRAILNKPEDERNPFERQMAWKAKQYLDPKSHEYIADTAAVAGKLKGDTKKRWQELKKQLDEFADLHPGQLPVGSAMTDIGSEAPRTFLLFKGSFEKPKEEVPPGLLQILYRDPAQIRTPPGSGTTGRRTVLAHLLADPQNPLTARVIVNRIWQYHFGKGLVATSSDFGLKGARPTHPALLDWLASDFVGHGWSLKYLHRLIMASATYQQSSAFCADAAKVDEMNNLLWRFPRQRLEGEIIRDSALAVAGVLNTKMGGPSVFPELPTGMPTPRGGWDVNDDSSERNRRSVYVFVRRNTRYPMFDSFDMPDPHESCARRNVTTSPLQALTLLNSKLTLEWAQSFAGRVLDVAGPDHDKQVDAAFRFAFGRLPDQAEHRMATEFFRNHEEIVTGREHKGETLALPPGLSGSVEPAHAETLVDFCHMLINANEFVYVN
jgi:hypothetical protein